MKLRFLNKVEPNLLQFSPKPKAEPLINRINLFRTNFYGFLGFESLKSRS